MCFMCRTIRPIIPVTLAVFILVLVACGGGEVAPTPTSPPLATPTSSAVLPESTATSVPAATATPLPPAPTVAPTVAPTAAATATPAPAATTLAPTTVPTLTPTSTPEPTTAPAPTATPAPTETPVPTATAEHTPPPTATPTPTPTLAPGPDPTALLLGDGKLTDRPRRGYVWHCTTEVSLIGAQVAGPWIQGDTWDSTLKITVPGTRSWDSQISIQRDGDRRVITTNGVPDHPTGIFPIPTDSDAYYYDTNPNPIQASEATYELPAEPQLAEPSCVFGTVAIMTNGVGFFPGLSLAQTDATAWELLDDCGGQTASPSYYHYHTVPPCLPDPGTGHSNLLGYALDGFGLYGPRGEDGGQLSNVDLGDCHGHTHEIDWDGTPSDMFHYHLTIEFPYTISCYRGMAPPSEPSAPSAPSPPSS